MLSRGLYKTFRIPLFAEKAKFSVTFFLHINEKLAVTIRIISIMISFEFTDKEQRTKNLVEIASVLRKFWSERPWVRIPLWVLIFVIDTMPFKFLLRPIFRNFIMVELLVASLATKPFDFSSWAKASKNGDGQHETTFCQRFYK